MIALLEQIKNVLKEVNAFSVEERARNYFITYNAVNYILEISEHLRRTNFSFEASLILAEAIKSMEGNIILQDVKYLDKVTELYLKLAKIYEDGENYQEAVAVLENALKQYKDLKAIHELDQPVPAYIQAILSNNIKMIKVFLIKYNIQSGSLSPTEWRKKADE
jgi:tetratricopeptide (TPR) repeat protein